MPTGVLNFQAVARAAEMEKWGHLVEWQKLLLSAPCASTSLAGTRCYLRAHSLLSLCVQYLILVHRKAAHKAAGCARNASR